MRLSDCSRRLSPCWRSKNANRCLAWSRTSGTAQVARVLPNIALRLDPSDHRCASVQPDAGSAHPHLLAPTLLVLRPQRPVDLTPPCPGRASCLWELANLFNSGVGAGLGDSPPDRSRALEPHVTALRGQLTTARQIRQENAT